ncbi:MAG: DUF4365 and DUF1817 domain-containing protein [Alcanivorax jadensis]|uniref:DUF4365 and DUF1817 domain-containing protein n=1 Tax=Alcanivorax jadensis TaxID=64988 RepID=UPI003002A0E4
MSRKFPKVQRSTMQGEAGVNAVSTVVNDHLKCIFRKNHTEHDFGIDAYIDIVLDSGEVTGQCIAVQIKSGVSFFKTKTSNGYTFYGESKHLNYYINTPMPVLVILHNPESNVCYWVEFDPAKTERTETGWKINVPKNNEFCESQKSRILDLVGNPVDHSDVLENHWAFNETLNEFDFIYYAIDRIDIEERNVLPLKEFIDRISVNDSLCRKFQGRVEIMVSGYDDDPRELWEIKQVRRWFKKADSKIKYWFFFCNAELPAYGLKNYFSCLCGTKWLTEEVDVFPGANVEMNTKMMADLFDRNWPWLNEMTDRLGMSIEENKRISYQIMDLVHIPHEA